MAEKYTLDDLLSKIDWEGGILDAIQYGISHESLPDEVPPAVKAAWKKIEKATDDLYVIETWLNANAEE